MTSAIILLSGGLDSLVSAALAKNECTISQAITFRYGQRAEKNEIHAAKKLSEWLKAPHQTIDLTFLGKLAPCSLTESTSDLPRLSEVDLDDISATSKSAKSVWVPNRNGVMVNIAAAIAEANKIDLIVTGFNKEEAVTFPDNSPEFISQINETLKLSTLKHPILKSFVVDMTKSEMVRFAIDEGLPIELCWPCYNGGEKMCGKCESCLRFKRALTTNEELTIYRNLFKK